MIFGSVGLSVGNWWARETTAGSRRERVHALERLGDWKRKERWLCLLKLMTWRRIGEGEGIMRWGKQEASMEHVVHHRRQVFSWP